MRSAPLGFFCRSPVRCLASGGGGGGPLPPVPGSGSCAPSCPGLCVRGGPAPGGWGGGGGLCAALPRGRVRGGPGGGGWEVALPQSCNKTSNTLVSFDNNSSGCFWDSPATNIFPQYQFTKIPKKKPWPR